MKRGLRTNAPQQWFDKNRVNLPNSQEVIWQPLYDSIVVPAAGAQALRLFQNPIGQNGKTAADTNMELGGQIPKGQAFKVTGIEVLLIPAGNVSSAGADDISNDVNDFYNSGVLELTIGSKSFTKQAPLLRFPPSVGLGGFASTTVAATELNYSRAVGREYEIVDLLLESNQNFNVTLSEIPALPSGQPAVVFITLNGYLARNAQ